MVTPLQVALKSTNKGNLKSLLPNFGIAVINVKSDLILTICILSQSLLSSTFIKFEEKSGNFTRIVAALLML